MKKLLGIVVLGLLLVSCSDLNNKSALENCATKTYLEDGEGMIANKYYYSDNDWVILSDKKFLEKTKIMVGELPDIIPGSKYYEKIEGIHSKSFDEKVKILHQNYVQIKNYSENPFFIINTMPYMLERSDLLEKKIPKLSLKKKRNLIGFIEFYQNCERASIRNPETFKLKYVD